MDKALVDVLAVVQLAWWPFSKLLSAVRLVLSPVLRAVIVLLSPIAIVGRFVLLPFIHLIRALFLAITFPLQVKWLERIETLYIFLGTAGLIGCLAGAVLYFISSFLASSLSIDATSKTQPRTSRTAAEYRAARREKREKREHFSPDRSSPSHVILDRTPASRRKGLLSQTIVEEEDSDL